MGKFSSFYDDSIYDISAFQLFFDEKNGEKIVKKYKLKQIYERDFPELKKMRSVVPSGPEKFLPFLLSKIIDPEPDSPKDARNELAALAVVCAHPRFLFGEVADWDERSQAPSFSYKALESLLVESQKFEARMVKFVHEYQLCLKYIKRGTTDLDRDPKRAPAESDSGGRTEKLTPAEKDKLIHDLNACYISYYHCLLSCGYRPRKCPVVTPRLVENCYEKEWLLPLAHIILVRDAQYQMLGMNKRSYKKATLLQPYSLKFILEHENANAATPMAEAALITYNIALDIRNILEHHLRKHLASNPVAYALQGLISAPQYCINNKLAAVASLARVKYELDIKRVNEDQAELLFPVPDCEPHVLAIQIGEALKLETSQVDQLAAILPDLLWNRGNVQDPLDKIVSADSTTGQNLIELVRTIKKFLDPKRYYSKDSIVDPLIRSAMILDKAKIKNTGINAQAKAVKHAFSSFIVFRDLTAPALLISHAIELEDGVLIPTVLEHYVSKLKKILKKYHNSDFITEVMGSRYDIYEFEFDHYDPRFRCEKEDISKTLTWSQAKDFLEKCLVENSRIEDKKLRSRQQRNYLAENYSTQLQKLGVNALDDTRDEFVYYKLFSYLLKASLRLLQIEVLKKMASLLDKSFHTEAGWNSEG